MSYEKYNQYCIVFIMCLKSLSDYVFKTVLCAGNNMLIAILQNNEC